MLLTRAITSSYHSVINPQNVHFVHPFLSILKRSQKSRNQLWFRVSHTHCNVVSSWFFCGWWLQVGATRCIMTIYDIPLCIRSHNRGTMVQWNIEICNDVDITERKWYFQPRRIYRRRSRSVFISTFCPSEIFWNHSIWNINNKYSTWKWLIQTSEVNQFSHIDTALSKSWQIDLRFHLFFINYRLYQKLVALFTLRKIFLWHPVCMSSKQNEHTASQLKNYLSALCQSFIVYE